MYRFFFSLLLIICIGFGIYFLVQRTDDLHTASSSRLRVVASFYPLAEFSRQIGGNLVEVQTVVPAGMEPHDYEPTPKEIGSMYDADIVVYHGSGIDAWADKIRFDLEKNKVSVLRTMDFFPLYEKDPHIWLDPVLIQKEVEILSDAFVKLDAQNASLYRKNTRAYIQKLKALDRDYASLLGACKKQKVIVSHDAFGYLSRRYNLDFLSITGLSPEQEPSLRRLADLTKMIRENKIRVVFFETLVTPKFAETLARETGTKTSVLNPLEGLTSEEMAAGKNYLSVMRDNLHNLLSGYGCA